MLHALLTDRDHTKNLIALLQVRPVPVDNNARYVELDRLYALHQERGQEPQDFVPAAPSACACQLARRPVTCIANGTCRLTQDSARPPVP